MDDEDYDRFESGFRAAVAATIDDHERYGAMDTDLRENGAMRVVGIRRGDAIRLTHLMLDAYEPELGEGGAQRNTALHAIIEIALATGVHLERARWEQLWAETKGKHG